MVDESEDDVINLVIPIQRTNTLAIIIMTEFREHTHINFRETLILASKPKQLLIYVVDQLSTKCNLISSEKKTISETITENRTHCNKSNDLHLYCLYNYNRSNNIVSLTIQKRSKHPVLVVLIVYDENTAKTTTMFH